MCPNALINDVAKLCIMDQNHRENVSEGKPYFLFTYEQLRDAFEELDEDVKI